MAMDEDDKTIPDTVVDENYVLFQHEFIEFLVAQLIDFRKVFNGDLDELLVFIFVARYHLREERGRRRELDPDGHWSAPPTLSRIAEQTGIPRETVRRKLLGLQSRGLLEKVEQDRWHVSVRDDMPIIRSEYEEFWRREMKRLVRLARALKPYV
jgi:IclR helix-turn-helix domain